ncbi:TPA: ead/Ea22-like family protein [Enterobacter roggenkampii]|nr:ead/Ea22-like family protein [Enterobacter roggenkampii]
MSNIDKHALREAAERAGQNDWEYVYTSDLIAPGRGYITVGGAEAIYCLNKAVGGVKQSENVLRYIAAASPEKMLALLDELEAAGRLIAELEGREVKPVKGEVLVTVSGFTGCGKSAIAGEIEIAMKAIGVPVTWSNGDAEKRMTGADWLTAIEMYKPTVRIIEVNVPRAAAAGKGE